MNINEYIINNILYLDGGMGTVLQDMNILNNDLPERLNITHPDIITKILGNVKDKTFMLMPLNKEERLSYGRCGYVIRVVISIVFVAGLNIIIFVMRDHNLWANIFTLITNVIFIFQINIEIKPVNGVWNKGYLTCSVFAAITIILTVIINGIVKKDASITMMSLINIPLILVQIFIFIQTYRKYFEESILAGMCYGNGEAYENNN